ncbi:ABC transporter ATP-binding protein [Paracoccus caeni]|nr:ABC transporter ATP-binding protein [Paracoccus caeni]
MAKTGTDKSVFPERMAALRLIGFGLGGDWRKLAASVALATASVFFQLLLVWITWRLVLSLIEGRASPGLFFQAAVGGLAAVALYGLTFGLAMALSHRLAFDSILRIRLMMARHMAMLPLGWFADCPTGMAKKLVIDEPEQLELLIAHAIPEGTSAAVNWLALSVWLFVIDWRMALASIILTPLAAVAITYAMSRTRAETERYRKSQAQMNAAVVEYLAGMAVTKIFNRTDLTLARASDAVREQAAAQTAWALRYLPLGGSALPLAMASICVILTVGVWLMQAGQLDLATLAFFVIVGANYSRPLLKLFGLLHQLSHISLGAVEVLRLMRAPAQPDTGRHLPLGDHSVTFGNVRFGYDDRTVLHDVSFTAPAGEVTALVGPSGAGKSTIAGLILRTHDIQDGQILIGGVDIRDMAVDQLMQTVAVVFQQTFLFSDTVEANLRLAKPQATEAELIAACRAAQAHDFIQALPEGYATRIGAQGRMLSGGERQRLAIARAILKDAPVILLDEATAATDLENEAAIHAAMSALARGRTLIVIAHRLHTIRHADQILVVEGGRIVERGDHASLSAGTGAYARLWRDYRSDDEDPQLTQRRHG